jgi:hypothetical protein
MEGVNCVCMAHHENECGCGADWTTSEVYALREEVKKLREANKKVTRFEVIDHTDNGVGRQYWQYDVSVELSYQDEGKTLKVFLQEK